MFQHKPEATIPQQTAISDQQVQKEIKIWLDSCERGLSSFPEVATVCTQLHHTAAVQSCEGSNLECSKGSCKISYVIELR